MVIEIKIVVFLVLILPALWSFDEVSTTPTNENYIEALLDILYKPGKCKILRLRYFVIAGFYNILCLRKSLERRRPFKSPFVEFSFEKFCRPFCRGFTVVYSILELDSHQV